MKLKTTSERLKEYMSEYDLKPVDILEKAQPLCIMYDVEIIDKLDLSQYISGEKEPEPDKLYILAITLGVPEIWLMGYDYEEPKAKRAVDRIQDDLGLLGIPSFEMMKKLGFSQDLFLLWKDNKRKPSLYHLQRIANYLEENIFYLRQDELRLEAIKKFGFCYEPKEAERIKDDSRGLIATHSLTLEEELNENINVFKALFSRSLYGSEYNLKHVDLNTYVAMSLNQEQWKNNCGEKIYNMLVDIYGKQKGIPTGTQYHLKK